MSFAEQLKGLFYGAFVSLPMVLIAIVGFLGVTLGNLGLIMLTVGHVILIPFLLFFINLFHEYFFPGSPYFSMVSSDLSYLVPMAATPGVTITAAPSYWIAHVTFFFTFLFTNALVMYLKDPSPSADPNKVENRKAQTMTAMLLTLIAFLAVMALRIFLGNEPLVGALFGALLIVPVSYGWYELTRVCGARDADIFGILQKILPPNAKDDPPMTCVYSP